MPVVAVVIDKWRLSQREANITRTASAFNGMERVRRFLHRQGQHEALTHIVCEARGAKEDADLELAFRRACDGENRTRAPYAFDIVMCDKKTNSEGLQLADLIARLRRRHQGCTACGPVSRTARSRLWW